MGIPYNVSRVLTFFQRKIYAYDLYGEIRDHSYMLLDSSPYAFIGVLIPPTDQDLQLFDEGEISAGAMILYVISKIELHIADDINQLTDGIRQTIVQFDGRDYRVKGQSNRKEDGLHRKYTLVRYMGKRTNGDN